MEGLDSGQTSNPIAWRGKMDVFKINDDDDEYSYFLDCSASNNDTAE